MKSGLGVWGLGFRDWGLGVFGGVGFRVLGLRDWEWGPRAIVDMSLGSYCRVHGSFGHV